MKKYLLLFTLTLSSIYCFGQKYLTNAQVYNFNVGDVFESTMGNTYTVSPPNYIFDSIIAKWYSATGDTLYYNYIEYTYLPPACPPPCTGSSTGPSYKTYTITNLDSAAGFITMGEDCPTKDTVYTDASHEYCGKRVYKKYPVCSDSAFEPTTTNSWDIEGCGGGYFDSYDPSSLPAGGDYTHLIFFRKHDTVCGGENIITGINKLITPVTSVTLYPNPASVQITIIYQLSQGQHSALLKLYNTMGQLVKSEFINNNAGQFTEDISTLSGGIYYYMVSVDGSIDNTNKLVILK
jgi:type IX secretion system substrate protein